MTTSSFEPPFNAPQETAELLRSQGFAVVDAAGTAALLHTSLDDLEALRGAWDDLSPDRYLKDGGTYRRRRHSCFVVAGERVEQTAHRMHWQPVEYNALHGGMERWFEPIAAEVIARRAWTQLIQGIADICSQVRPVPQWSVEAHQFRIDTAAGIGRPTPEGAHRDGVDFVAVLLIARRGVKGGETRVFAADGRAGQRFTMTQPWTMLLLDDARVVHETTPIQPLIADEGSDGVRDTLVVTLRADGFQQ
ncbi:MAG: 2OG-Fe dioxygenase family protein [Burkholderiaceae bacterium]